MREKRFLFGIGTLLMLVLVLGGLVPRQVEALDRSTNLRVMRSVVQLIAVDEGRDGGVIPKWGGSGSIISKDGLILTNCHVVNPLAMGYSDDFSYDAMIVMMTIRSDEPPVPTYIAQIVQYDPVLDLAVIRITHMLDGSPVDPDDLNLPFLALGDSDDLEIGDALSVFGYPSIGGETITLTTGNVSGFSRERGIEGRAWIKTDATIAGGNSGGTAVNEEGLLVGVPTQGGSGSDTSPYVDCRRLADTDGDGDIDEDDSCVPMGGFINALRPLHLAMPMIEAAMRGLSSQPDPDPKPKPTPTPLTGDADIGRLFFAPAVNEYDQPVTVVESFPSGTNEIYILFDYENFQDGMPWQPVLVYEGETYDDIWVASGWSGGANGTWWISIYNDPLPDGEYEFVFYYDGAALGSVTMELGGQAQNLPSFVDLTFSSGSEQGYILPAGVDELEGDFLFVNMTSSTDWSYVWYYEGEQVYSDDGSSFSSDSGEDYVAIENRSGFEPGSYRLDLYIEDRLATTGNFIVGGSSEDGGQDVFGSITFAEDVDRNDEPVNPHAPGESFESGTTAFYAFFDYQGMQDDWEWTRRWYLDGEMVAEMAEAWFGGDSGNWWLGLNNGSDALPDGQYELELLVQGQVVQSASTTIGDGSSQPRPTPTPTDGVEIYGYLVDADTGQGIQGAMIIFLQPGITVDEFQWIDEEVYALGEADRNGYYELSDPLVRGETYSIIIGAQGYNMIAEDDIFIPDDLESPFQLDVTLQESQ